MFVKICGVTHSEAVAAAVEAGADALGFVFAPSARRVSSAQARTLCATLDARILRVAVMRHPDPTFAATVIEEFAPDWLQTDAEDLDGLVLPPGCAALPVYRDDVEPAVDKLPAQLLFEGPTSGSGQLADWRTAARLANSTRMILAGGLNPDNVEDAIRRIRPWGVDVSTGVERAPGDKDPEKIRQFVLRAKAVALENPHAS